MTILYHDRSNYNGIEAQLNKASFLTAYKPSNSQLGGWVGNAINKAGSLSPIKLPEKNISESLQSWGGNPGSSFTWVKPAYADTSQKGAPLFTQEQLKANQAMHPVGAENYTSGGGGGGTGTNPNAGKPGFTEEGNPIEADPYAQIRAEIESGWNNYINEIRGIGNTWLPQQKAAQEGIAQTQYDSGVNQINTQKASSLRDIGANISNAFKAGNIFLGARGAGDSSAANQYQFALSQEASKQTGQLNEYVNGQLTNLKATYDTKIGEISQWFGSAQQQLQQAIAEGQLKKSQDIQNLSKDILNQALAAKQELANQTNTRYNALLEWAANNSSNVSQLRSNIASIPTDIASPTVDSRGNIAVATGYGYDNEKDKGLFR